MLWFISSNGVHRLRHVLMASVLHLLNSPK